MICNEVGCPLKFYEDTMLPFEDTSGAAAAAQQKFTFEDTSGAAEAAQREFDKEAYDASSRVSNSFSNKRKLIELQRGTCIKHNSISKITTPPRMNKLTIKNISPGYYVYIEEDSQPVIHSHVGIGYVTECIVKTL